LAGSTIPARRTPNRKWLVYIGIGSGVLIVALIVSISLNYYALSNLQFRARQAENFDFATMSMDVLFEACNPTTIPAGFDKLQMVVYYKDRDFATLTVHGGTLPPNQITVLRGNMAFNAQVVTGLFIQAFVDAFSEQQTQLDQQDMTVKTILDAKMMGIFPFSQSRTFTMVEFQEFMASSERSGEFSCI
jgi:hypothetical protein